MSSLFVDQSPTRIFLSFSAFIYPEGTRQIIRSVNKDNINYIEKFVGPQGGDHGWKIVGKNKSEYGNGSVNGDLEILESFPSRHINVLEKLLEIYDVRIETHLKKY